jgi:hypothetical protein
MSSDPGRALLTGFVGGAAPTDDWEKLDIPRVKLPLALAGLGLIEEYDLVVHRRLAGHGPTWYAALSNWIDLKLVSRREFGSGAVAMRYEPRRQSNPHGCLNGTHDLRRRVLDASGDDVSAAMPVRYGRPFIK